GAAAAAAATGGFGAGGWLQAKGAPHGRKLANVKKGFALNATDKVNAWEDITSYNNYYEFGTDKSDPAEYAKNFKTEPWTVTVEGESAKKGVMNLEDVLKRETLESRTYRHRCVAAWSLVIPWVGVPLGHFSRQCETTA